MIDDTAPARGVTAQEFFAAGIEGGSMTAAHLATKVAYSTIHRASKGDGISLKTARELERWSRSLGAEIFISAVLTLDVVSVDGTDGFAGEPAERSPAAGA